MSKITHMGLLNNAKSFQIRMGMEKGDHWLNCMPMFHTSGAGMAALDALPCVQLSLSWKGLMQELVCSCRERKINFLTAVLNMFVEILDAWKSGSYGVSKIKGMTGGTSVPPSLVKELHDLFGHGYKLLTAKQSSPVITLAWADDSLDNLTNSIGQPLPNIEVSIRSPKTNKILKVGETGEICSRGYNTMLEYHQNPEASNETIDSDNWLHTGDLGVMDNQGYVRISGRVKEMIIRGGENIYPKEIENILLEHEAISEGVWVFQTRNMER